MKLARFLHYLYTKNKLTKGNNYWNHCFRYHSGDIYFYDFKDYLTRILQIQDLQGQFIFDYDYNNGVIEHPSNGELWKKHEIYKNHLDKKTNRVHSHCPSQFYVDDFLQQKTRQVSENTEDQRFIQKKILEEQNIDLLEECCCSRSCTTFFNTKNSIMNVWE